MKYCELFNLYKKLKYIQKLKLVNRFNEMLCKVKKICNKKEVFFTGFKAEVSISVNLNTKKIKYIKCYGKPKDGCFDLELLNKL